VIGLLSENAQIRTSNNINTCIECLDPGDNILSAIITDTTIPTIQFAETTVIGIIKMLCDHFNIVDNELIANDYQEVLVNNEWYPISQLLSGSRLNPKGNMKAQKIDDKGNNEIIDDDIIELDRFDNQLDNIMYTLILFPYNTFFADGYIVKGEEK